MKIENINRKILCTPNEFVEIFKEGKVEIVTKTGGAAYPKQLEGESKKARIMTFLAHVNPPQQVLKIMGRNDVQLKEQQEVVITEGRIKIHTFYIPDILSDFFRVETFWNITELRNESGQNLLYLDISVHSESKVYVMGHLLEVFVASSVAASILQYLDIVDSYMSKWRKKLNQLLQLDSLLKSHKNMITVKHAYYNSNITSSRFTVDTPTYVGTAENDVALELHRIAENLQKLKTDASQMSQRILSMEIQATERIEMPTKPARPLSVQKTISDIWSNKFPAYNYSEDDFDMNSPPKSCEENTDSHRKLQELLEKSEASFLLLQQNQAVTELVMHKKLTDIEKLTNSLAQSSDNSIYNRPFMCHIRRIAVPLSSIVVVGFIYPLIQKRSRGVWI
jgi:hypothetical protein